MKKYKTERVWPLDDDGCPATDVPVLRCSRDCDAFRRGIKSAAPKRCALGYGVWDSACGALRPALGCPAKWDDGDYRDYIREMLESERGSGGLKKWQK